MDMVKVWPKKCDLALLLKHEYIWKFNACTKVVIKPLTLQQIS